MKRVELKVSVIMPAFNEEEWVAASIGEVTKAFDQLDVSGEVIVLDDGSSDDTAGIILNMARLDPRIRPVLLNGNLGFGGAVREGVQAASGSHLCLLPADWSYDSAAISTSIQAAQGFDVVCGWRRQRFHSVSPLRAIISWLVRCNVALLAHGSWIDVGGLNVYESNLFRRNIGDTNGYLFVFETIVRMMRERPRVTHVDISQIPSSGKRSGSASLHRAYQLLGLNGALTLQILDLRRGNRNS